MESTKLVETIIYTDGAAEPNPGRGGYGAVIMKDDRTQEIFGGYRYTTNQRMEVLAVIRALETLNGEHIKVYSDSKYVVDAFNEEWVYNWEKKNWLTFDGEKRKNYDLWIYLLELVRQHEVTFHWVRGHSGNEFNERCDELAKKGLLEYESVADLFYEKHGRKPFYSRKFNGV
jgi:ribonuclease HI